eukprot:3074492-Prymnesium_polylepis.2
MPLWSSVLLIPKSFRILCGSNGLCAFVTCTQCGGSGAPLTYVTFALDVCPEVMIALASWSIPYTHVTLYGDADHHTARCRSHALSRHSVPMSSTQSQRPLDEPKLVPQPNDALCSSC